VIPYKNKELETVPSLIAPKHTSIMPSVSMVVVYE
jgi:hypothetical protein